MLRADLKQFLAEKAGALAAPAFRHFGPNGALDLPARLHSHKAAAGGHAGGGFLLNHRRINGHCCNGYRSPFRIFSEIPTPAPPPHLSTLGEKCGGRACARRSDSQANSVACGVFVKNCLSGKPSQNHQVCVVIWTKGVEGRRQTFAEF